MQLKEHNEDLKTTCIQNKFFTEARILFLFFFREENPGPTALRDGEREDKGTGSESNVPEDVRVRLEQTAAQGIQWV